MTAISTAVGLERRSRVSGYRIKKGFFNDTTPNLPQIIAVFGEANYGNQGTLDITKREVTSAQEAGEIYGFGSPIHQIMRILRPINSNGVGGIPTVVFPQESDPSASVASFMWTITGTATDNATHTLIINGRSSVDFQTYSYNIVKGDTPTEIAAKIRDAVNSVLGSPVAATSGASAGEVMFAAKWTGSTGNKVNIAIDNMGSDVGVSYSETNITSGAGDVDLAPSFSQFDSDWYTCVINPYDDKLTEFEQFNGVPTGANPTGRYNAINFKPFMSFFGSVDDDKDNIAAITDDSDRVEQVTNVICPAPNSKGFEWEAASNVVRLFARVMQDTPQLTVNNMSYPDMPTPIDGVIGDMADYNNRDFLIKKGSSTVILENGSYKIQDLVTTYHPSGETPLQYAYCRNLNLDWNIKDGYSILENQTVKDHVIIGDNQVSDAEKTIKPKQWKAVLVDYFNDLAERALIREPQFSVENLQVQRGDTNPDRFETFFRYKRTGIARIESTDVEAGF